MSTKKEVVIIGAGVGGLALANILAKAGMRVTIYEQGSAAGGRMGVLKKDGFTFDTGPSWYLMKDVFEQYFALFDKTTEDYYELTRLKPAYKVFSQTHDPIVIDDSLERNLTTFEGIEPGAAKALRRYVSRGEQNYFAALEYFLYNPFKSVRGLLSWKVLRSVPRFAGVFTQSLHAYVKGYFSQQVLQQILEYPSVFLGASPFNTPALYQLMSYLDFKEGVFYPKKKGMYAVAEALENLGRELGVSYKFGSKVDKILVSKGRACGVRIAGKDVRADLVISNADLHFTETHLLDQPHRTYPDSYWTKRKAGPSALLMYLGVKGTLPQLEHHNLYFVKAWENNFDSIYTEKTWPKEASMYVSRTTATDASTAPKGHENLFVLVPLPAGVATDSDTVDTSIDQYLAQLERAFAIPNLRQRIVVKEVRTPEHFSEAFNSWQNTALGMSHTLRQTAFLRPSVKSKKVSNLYYVGAGAQPGIGVPMCIISAQLVYKHLARDWSPSAIDTIKEIEL